MDVPNRFCLDCRTLFTHADRCDAGTAHRVVDLGEAAGRDRVRDHVWGPPDLRRRAREAAQAGGVGAFFEGALSSCEGCSALDLASGFEGLAAVLFAMLVVFVVVAALYWAIAASVAWIRRRRARLRPVGVDARPKRRGERVRGEIVAGAAVVAPFAADRSRSRPVAWALRAESSDAVGDGPVLLRTGGTAGFRIRGDDGREVDVPPGDIALAPSDDDGQRVSASDLASWLEARGFREDDDVHPAFPVDRVSQTILSVGDRVVLDARLDPVAGGASSYREAAAVWRVAGTPCVTRSSA